MNAISRRTANNDLALALAAALLLQVSILIYFDRLAPMRARASSEPIIAEIYQMPHERTHLFDAKRPPGKEKLSHKPAPDPALKPATVSAPAVPPASSESNQTGSETVGISSHGPIVAFGPSPVLPDFLRAEALKASVLIEFTIEENGRSTPHLVASSGNDELDALALRAAREWRFSPAMRDNRPVAAQVRLRLKFEVK